LGLRSLPTGCGHRRAAYWVSCRAAITQSFNDPQQEYFSDGMTDELITAHAKLKSLKMTSHTSVERYKYGNRTLPDIARELGVDAVVEGAVMRSGDRVRITAQLIDARSE
jgi:TolB-like protein